MKGSLAAVRQAWRNPAVLRVSVLGATGSIGRNALDLVARTPEAFEVVALTAQNNAEELARLAVAHRARVAAIGDAACYGTLKAALAGSGVKAIASPEGLLAAASEPADCVVAAMVGAAGLAPTLAAVRQGRRVALANKECLVSAGEVFIGEVNRAGAELVPVDSEHSAVFQAIGGNDPECIEQVTLTASGGPFRALGEAELARVTPEAAVRHPTWSMGRKISVDSATLMNKGLELIEAYHLFPVEARQLAVLVHPQSIVHCLVAFRDGSVIAQLANPDMRTPIALALAWPSRMAAPTERLDLLKVGSLTFEPPDETRFPALRLAREALDAGGSAPAVLNAANEVAVEAFLERRLGFLDIARSVEACLDRARATGLVRPMTTVEEVLEVDREARVLARTRLSAYV